MGDTIKWYSCSEKDHFFCSKCYEFKAKSNRNPINTIHQTKNLYFVYNNNKTFGPRTKDEIVSLYVTKKLVDDILFVMSADTGTEWIQLTFPTDSKLDSKDIKRCDKMQECEVMNAKFRKAFPQLYESLIEDVCNKRIKKIVPPQCFPNESRNSSILRLLISFIGKILAIGTAFIVMHCLPTLMLMCFAGCLCCAICVAWKECFGDNDDSEVYVVLAILFIGYSGILFTPIIAVHITLSQANEWNEIQSWMISYIVWGIFSFFFPVLFLLFTAKNGGMANKVTEVVLMIIGIDFGGFNLLETFGNKDFGAQEVAMLFAVLFIFPTLASLLPAAICGFIANFVLEEKFELKCDGIGEYDCVVETERGCCDIISSHELENSYAFIGGLASNIIATWAIIRIFGYLFVNAFPTFSLYAKRKK